MTKALACGAILVGLILAAPASAVSPGANGRLIYTLQTPGNYDIRTINPDGSGDAPLITDPASDQGASWSPDGSKIAFRSDRTAAGDIYVANADGTNQVRLTTDPGTESHPSFSPDGTKIVFVRRDPDDEIFVMNADGSGVTRLTDNTITDAGPDWSPDGTRIAFFRGNNVIHVMNADGSDQRELVPGNFSVGPQWSPDARRVLFNRNNAMNDPDPHVVNADGTGLVNLGAEVSRSQAPSWSPDGTKIVLLTGSSGSDITIMNADGSGPVTVVDDALARSGPRWQPIPRAPAAQTSGATDLTTTSAKLNGTTDSNVLHPTTFFFEYGTTTAYGARTGDAGAPAPVGPQSVSADIAGLAPGTTYHARLVARNAVGTTHGPDQTFTTPALPAPVSPARLAPRSLTVKAKPRHDREAPFRYVFSGRLVGPAGTAATQACNGNVTIVVKRGRRTVARRRAKLSRSCTYRKVVSFKSTRKLRASRGRLKVSTSFAGNAALTSKRGKALFVRFG